MTIKVSLGNLDKAIREVNSYAMKLEEKSKQIVERLASLGATNMSLEFARAIIDENDVQVSAEWINDTTMVIKATGTQVAFIEFGAGIRYGNGHPQNSEFGTGAGTYPNGKGHWDDPNGWWYTDESGVSHHSYGNPPNMPMYNTARLLEQQVEQIVREVFST